ncbi:CehA/McbA family metallohydrolase [Microbulbifer pacificus]|uniref:CehA/McbA family metallohydrolase n=1 Tax=Microbulbifer pacificus TaxID=407164 RepID=A0AAU0N3E0_9GAMM|nr:CehA/McbA family metallohydrolase [Microbulbifer pacificus]WOX06799.1 CehA/McbA family metallohydrolase [Microbulbifer pacificus]
MQKKNYFLCALIMLLSVAVQAAPTVIVLDGKLTRKDHQTYLEVPFKVPAGTDRVTVEFSYDRSEGTTIDLGLLDSERLRGWSGGNKSHFTLAETDATPSYLPGPLPAGEWRLLLGIPNIREGITTAYTARITLQHGAEAFTESFTDQKLADGARWYRGELHAHTGHSDGGCRAQSGEKKPCPLLHTVQAAAERGLDFISISEHNARSQYNGLRELQAYYDRLLLIPGREITTFYGHANIFGSTGFVDFRVTDGNVRPLQDKLPEIGAIMSINHPGLPSGEACMGCGWTAETDYTRVTAIEVVNGSVLKRASGQLNHPFSGIPFWEALLDQGYRISAIAGSDNHDAIHEKDQLSGIGLPLTAIYAESLSQPSLLDGLRAGRVFIDLQGKTDRSLEIEARSADRNAGMGAVLHVDGPVTVSVRVQGITDAKMRLIAGGKAIEQQGELEGDLWQTEFTLPKGRDLKWLRVEILDANGNPQLLSNPVYIEANS